jgi:prepilin peptidase CpaA
MALILPLLAMTVFAAAALTDVAGRRIPNRLVLALAALAALRIGLALASGAGPAGVAADIGVALAVFLVGALVFHFGMIGGGDVKLIAAGVLWTGAGAAGEFLLATAIAGGVLAGAFLLQTRLAPRPEGAAAKLRPPSLPYGIAIAAGGILTTAAAF